MNTKDVALALDAIAEGFAALSMAIEAPQTSVHGTPAGAQPEAGAGVSPPLPSAPAGIPNHTVAPDFVPTSNYSDLPPSFDELPPDDGLLEVAIRTTGGTEVVTTDVGLGYCPTHKTPWTVKPAGVSKVGKQYNAFWKCDDRSDGFCNQKPVGAWKNSHPIREGAAA